MCEITFFIPTKMCELFEKYNGQYVGENQWIMANNPNIFLTNFLLW